MQTFDIREAKSRLSQLVDQAAKGEAFAISKGGKPLAKIVAFDTPMTQQIKRRGFMAGEISVPEDFDRMGGAEMDGLFGGDA